jgi:hypothetical protein
MNILFSVEFNGHTDPYINGFIGAIDTGYSLKLPYTDYTSVITSADGSGTDGSQPVVTFFHQSTAPTP